MSKFFRSLLAAVLSLAVLPGSAQAALLLADSVDHYATAEVLQKHPSSILVVGGTTITVDASGGRNGTAGFKYDYAGNNAALYVRGGVAASGDTGIIGMAFQATSLAASNSNRSGIISFLSGATVLASIRVNTDGSISVMRGTSGGTVLGTSAPSVIGLSTWYYIEYKTLLSATVGTYEVRVNGVNVLSGTGANTSSSTTWDGYNLFGNTASLSDHTGFFYVDDLYVADGSGSVNNDFFGPIRVKAVLPDGAGNSTDFTPSAGSNYQNVDEASTDGDTTYNSETTLADHDTYTFGAVGITGTVLGVQTNLLVRSDGAGGETIRPKIRIGSTDYNGTSVNVTTSYLDYMEIFELSPATAAAWTVTEINGAEFGLELEN